MPARRWAAGNDLSARGCRLLAVVVPPVSYLLYWAFKQRSEPGLGGALVAGPIEDNTEWVRIGVGTILFCELRRGPESFLCQPASGLSSFAYLLVPCVIAWQWGRLPPETHAPPFATQSLENVVLAAASVYLASLPG